MELKQAKKRGFYLEHEGKNLSSKVDPIAEAERVFHSIKTPKGLVFLLLGFSPFYHIELLAQEAKQVYVIDPRISDYSFLDQFKEDLKTFFENLEAGKIILLSSLEKLKELLARDSLEDMRIVDTISKNNSEGSSKELDAWKKELLQVFRIKVRTKITETYFEMTWSKNALMNICHLLKGRNSFFLSDFKIKTEKAFVFVSSGVFLERDIDFLKENRESFYVIAVVSVFAILDHHGISPDVLVSSDGGFYNTYHFHDLFEKGKKIPLIAPISLCKNPTHDGLGEVYYYFDDENIMLKLLEEQGFSQGQKQYFAAQFLPMNPSVTINALYLMKYWNLKKIYLSGIDFQLLPFRYHCDGNVSEEILFQKHQRLSGFETRYHEIYYQKLFKLGNIWTTEILALYKQEFDKVARNLGIETSSLKNFDGKMQEVSSLEITSVSKESFLKEFWRLYLDAYKNALKKSASKHPLEFSNFFQERARQWEEK